ncbi:thioredoxin domain-containing protein [Flavobacterium sp.]|uniref:thioredoxin domain-containing protein n=1 Tax=Flavobacterium sp. TaxID=239 RepID=UPI0025C0E3D2|nr:thioredoxin domain-containing protein [Flavobacterium sp.]MBA4277134.1 thioredoxin [Flavobacterium sp.]
MKISSVFLLLLTFTIFSCNGQTSKNITDIDTKTFSEKITAAPNAQIIDVRTPQEFASGHIDNAVNIDWLSDNFVANTQKLDKTKPVFLYCKTSNRSTQAAKKLEELGFTTIYNMKGGLLQWDAEGLSKPTDKIIGVCSQEYAELLNTDKKVLIDFYAEWCAPCKKMTPYLLKMQKELADKVTIIRLNADENPTLVKEMKILELPTLLLYENKEIKWKHSGFISEEDLKKQLQ